MQYDLKSFFLPKAILPDCEPVCLEEVPRYITDMIDVMSLCDFVVLPSLFADMNGGLNLPFLGHPTGFRFDPRFSFPATALL